MRIVEVQALLALLLGIAVLAIGGGIIYLAQTNQGRLRGHLSHVARSLSETSDVVEGFAADFERVVELVPQATSTLQRLQVSTQQARTMVTGLVEAGSQLASGLTLMSGDLRTLYRNLPAAMRAGNNMELTADQLEAAAGQITRALPQAEALLEAAQYLSQSVESLPAELELLESLLQPTPGRLLDAAARLDHSRAALESDRTVATLQLAASALGGLLAALGLALVLLAWGQRRIGRRLQA